MNKIDIKTYEGILQARKAAAKILVMDNLDATTVAELPQILVETFNMLTDILHMEGEDRNGTLRTHFDEWWLVRDSLEASWRRIDAG